MKIDISGLTVQARPHNLSQAFGLILFVWIATSLYPSASLNGQDKTEPNTPSTQQETEKSTESQPAEGSKNEKVDEAKEAKAEPIAIKVAGEAIEFTASGTWKQVPPKSGMIEAEIKIPKLGDDTEDGRLTIMGAGGSIEANISRWQGQFAQEDGEAVEAKTEIKTINDHEVHMVDLAGTYMDMPGGPFAGGKAIERENYRMLAAIVATEKHGNYFVKLYGPQHTIEQNKAHFEAMIESLKVTPAESDSDPKTGAEPDSNSDSEKLKKHGAGHPLNRGG